MSVQFNSVSTVGLCQLVIYFDSMCLEILPAVSLVQNCENVMQASEMPIYFS